MSLIPKFIRTRLEEQRLKKQIFSYYNSLPAASLNNEERAALEYIRSNRLRTFTSAFQYGYDRRDVNVLYDDKVGLHFVLLDGKRLYFRRNSKPKDIQRDYNYLRIEQDIQSPHRYLTKDFNVDSGSILVDVGAAEGNLPLSVIEKIDKAYLFETDPAWIEALTATFAPWKDKVEIVNMFVSDRNENGFVSLDVFFKEKSSCNFIKVDAEGAEADILKGAEGVLAASSKLKMALCCYHKPNDEHLFEKHFSLRGFAVSFAPGYMIFRDNFVPPYLRRGVLRAIKNS